jgi:hypothetical protein
MVITLRGLLDSSMELEILEKEFDHTSLRCPGLGYHKTPTVSILQKIVLLNTLVMRRIGMLIFGWLSTKQ